MIGPIFGGLFVTYWSWRGVFFVNVPIGVAILLLAPHYIPRDRQQIEHPKLSTDGLGMVLLGIGLLAGMLAASGFGEKGLSPVSPMIVASLAVAVAAFWRFFRHLSRAAEPFIAPHLIYGRGFGAVNLVNGFYGGITGGTIALIPLYATNRYGLDALASGTLLVAEGAAAIALAVVAALALRKTGNRRPLYAGSVITALGIVLLALNPVGGISPYAWLAGSAFLVGAGGGMANPAGRNAGLQLAPEHSGVIAALRSMSMQVGSITTISVATALLARSANPGMMQAWFFFAAAALCIVGLPMIRRVPEHFGSW
jgi:MFS family permease